MDQFLEHLIEAGVEKIVRIGGQSKSTKLGKYNLEYRKRYEKRKGSEMFLVRNAYANLDECKEEARNLLCDIHDQHQSKVWANLKDHVEEKYYDVFSQFCSMEPEGCEVPGSKGFDTWCELATPTNGHAQPGTAMDDILCQANMDVNQLTGTERYMLLDHWVREIHTMKAGELLEVISNATTSQTELDSVSREVSRRILQDADVIGMTTSGLAHQISLIRAIESKVLICEEAAEILEPHMLSALLPTVEHCIQIGDHQQLRPTVANFRDLSIVSQLGKLHPLDQSQFERLSVGYPGRFKLPVVQLNTQRRMRPEISTLIRETMYPELVDHESLAFLPNVVGLRRNLFWMNHRNLEDGNENDLQHVGSRSNAWEVEMVRALVRHIVKQGTFENGDIAILTPYAGQLRKLREAMQSVFEIELNERDQKELGKDDSNINRDSLKQRTPSEQIRIATVDNFQGEEAKIIIVSLVRSNESRNVGFLNVPNRINVLLSRAKHGMYLIGNVDTYWAVPMWQKIIEILQERNLIGEMLSLQCPRHPNRITQVREADEFAKFSPEGGCRDVCAERLDCGHDCQARCHSKIMHAVVKCEQPCGRFHQECGHLCLKDICHEPCGQCMVPILDVKLPCGHVQDQVPCSMIPNPERIFRGVNFRNMKEGHSSKPITFTRRSEDVDKKSFECPVDCGITLPCGHMCRGICGQCRQIDRNRKLVVVKHQQCTEKCEQKLDCNHFCEEQCHNGTDCGPCRSPCEVN